MSNGNLTTDHVSKKGLHLNGKGTGRLALNIITYLAPSANTRVIIPSLSLHTNYRA